jgi:branched-subunit amino acid transport protein
MVFRQKELPLLFIELLNFVRINFMRWLIGRVVFMHHHRLPVVVQDI